MFCTHGALLDMFHRFEQDISRIALPDTFTCPFCYVPHVLSVMAANQVQDYLRTRTDWQLELQEGKMFGVLVVKKEREVGFVAAFSGQIQGKNLHEYFVPPVYDLVQEHGFFKQGERIISDINHRIEHLMNDTIFSECQAFQIHMENELQKERVHMKQAKTIRDEKRKHGVDANMMQQLTAESQFQKAEYKRIQTHLNEEYHVLTERRGAVQNQIDTLKEERRTRSQELQRQIFEKFVFQNAEGKQRGLLDIFENTVPPSGSGECAAPRLLQYAYLNHLQPIAMAEFWWGRTSKDGMRRQGCFYGACKQKCEPILQFMLQGLDVEENKMLSSAISCGDVTILYEDDDLVVVDKPSGVLSVPGLIPQSSLLQWAEHTYGQAFAVHRLDMATSGVLVIAKTMDVCRDLQRQFEERFVKKKYVALLDGVVGTSSGTIELSLRPDYEERPRQIVDKERGKPAITRYEVVEQNDGRTRVNLYPLTGRTHQLRVHAAHSEGLNCPIVGDLLYGVPADRLYLHAEEIVFVHPRTGKELKIVSPAPF